VFEISTVKTIRVQSCLRSASGCAPRCMMRPQSPGSCAVHYPSRRACSSRRDKKCACSVLCRNAPDHKNVFAVDVFDPAIGNADAGIAREPEALRFPQLDVGIIVLVRKFCDRQLAVAFADGRFRPRPTERGARRQQQGASLPPCPCRPRRAQTPRVAAAG